MPISNPVQALIKLVSEDSVNGLPIRNADDQGTVPSSKSRTTVLASAAYTTSGVSAAVQPNGLYNEILLLLRITAASGTNPTLNVFVDTSDDGGTTWYQINQLGPSNISSVPTLTQNAYPTGYTLTLDAANSNQGSWGDTFRIRYQIGGTTPSFTFMVTAIQKNST
jgi:hypothetical protein